MLFLPVFGFIPSQIKFIVSFYWFWLAKPFILVLSRKLNLLSFGEEAGDEENELANVKTKIKSSHDVLDDPRLLKEANQANDKVV